MAEVRRALAGISGVHVTPDHASGDVDARKRRDVVSFIAEAGIDNVVTAGNTGEFHALTQDEVVHSHARFVIPPAGSPC